MSVLHPLRSEYHRRTCGEILGMKDGIFNNADRDSMTSRQIAEGIARQLPYPFCLHPPSGQTAGKRFEEITAWFLQETFQQDMLGTLLSGRRLRDIADLPFDLAI